MTSLNDLNSSDTGPDDRVPVPVVDNQQAMLVERLLRGAVDPVYELKTLFGANHRTCERWIKGTVRMPPVIQQKLLLALMGIEARVAELEAMSAHNRLYAAIASTRVKIDEVL